MTRTLPAAFLLLVATTVGAAGAANTTAGARRAAASASPVAPAAATRAADAMARAVAIENNASCDISTSPAATLLLPFFEVEIARPVNDAANTLFTIINTSREPQIARVTIWTDYGVPALWFNVFLTGYDVQPVSLYDVLARGEIPVTSAATSPGGRSAANDANRRIVSAAGCAVPSGQLPAATLEALQQSLTSGVAAAGECRVGSAHANATGYITVDVVNSCSPLSPLDPAYYSQILNFDNVLTGDYEHVYPDAGRGNYAGGAPLVHLKALPGGGSASAAPALPYTFYDRYTPAAARRIDRRQPLPSSFAARYIQGGTADFFTDIVFWREGVPPNAKGCTSVAAAEMPLAQIVRFDDAENPTTIASGASPSIPSAAAIDTKSTAFPPLTSASLAGWLYVNLDNRSSAARPSQNWVVIRMHAEGRYGVDYDATAMTNGCSPNAVVSSVPPIGGVRK